MFHKFIDGADESGFFPYLFLRPVDLAAGTLRFSGDFRLESGSQPSLEFRTIENRRTYPVGPSLRFGPEGTLRTEQGRKLLVVPHDQWFRVEITCLLGSGRYTARIVTPDHPPREFRDLPCVGDTSFLRCGWIGICSNARAKSVFYVDNLRVEREVTVD